MESTSTFFSNCWPSLYVIGKTVWCRRRAEVARRTRVEVVRRRDFWDRLRPHQLIDLPVRYFLNTSSKVRAKRMAGNDYKGVIIYALKMHHRFSWYCPKAYTCGLKDWNWLAVLQLILHILLERLMYVMSNCQICSTNELTFSNSAEKTCWGFLDAIASPSTYPGRSVSESVGR